MVARLFPLECASFETYPRSRVFRLRFWSVGEWIGMIRLEAAFGIPPWMQSARAPGEARTSHIASILSSLESDDATL